MVPTAALRRLTGSRINFLNSNLTDNPGPCTYNSVKMCGSANSKPKSKLMIVFFLILDRSVLAVFGVWLCLGYLACFLIHIIFTPSFFCFILAGQCDVASPLNCILIKCGASFLFFICYAHLISNTGMIPTW